MFKKNYHTHTFRCNHAIGTDEEYVHEAIAGGFDTLDSLTMLCCRAFLSLMFVGNILCLKTIMIL